jgi:hypothetical protein
LNTTDLIRAFFQSKTQQLLAVSRQAVVEHSGLKGAHREEIINIYLKEILPKRFGIGKGMVYGLAHRSKEVDILVWDEQNYPELRMLGHSLFFAESAKAIIEVKTRWNTAEFEDIKGKASSSKGIFKTQKTNIIEHLTLLENQISAMQYQQEFSGILSTPYHTAFAAFIFQGGENFSLEEITEEQLSGIDDNYPDLIVFLSAGRVLAKEYDRHEDGSMSGQAFLRLYESKDDTLLLFTEFLMGEIMERTVLTEYPFYFRDYFFSLTSKMRFTELEYPMTRPLPGGQKTFWN